jgi:flagellar protein FlbD
MIRLTRLNHQEITINAEIIEHIESTPDTLIKLTNGQTIMVRESVDQVVQRVVEYKRRIWGLAEVLPSKASTEEL